MNDVGLEVSYVTANHHQGWEPQPWRSVEDHGLDPSCTQRFRGRIPAELPETRDRESDSGSRSGCRELPEQHLGPSKREMIDQSEDLELWLHEMLPVRRQSEDLSASLLFRSSHSGRFRSSHSRRFPSSHSLRPRRLLFVRL